MAVRYSRILEQDIRKTVRNYNAKIRRLEKTERDLVLPDRITINEIKESVDTRKQLNRKLKALERFTKRGAEDTVYIDGLKTSKYQVGEVQRELRRVKAQLTRQISIIEQTTPTIFGQKADATYKQMGSIQLNNLKTRRKSYDFGSFKKITSEKFKELQDKLRRDIAYLDYDKNIFMNNVVDNMIEKLAYKTGYDNNDKLNHLKQQLSRLSPDQFLKLYNTEEGIRAIVDYYPSIHSRKPEDIKDEVENLFNELDDNIEGIVNTYLNYA